MVMMTLPMVTCPLCCQPGFNTSDALSSALVSASTRKLSCPVCNEVLIGLDKLTIHLLGHNTSEKALQNSNSQNADPNKILVSRSSTNDPGNPVVAPVLYIQSDNGQLFALAASSLVNQFGTVTINTQNYISNTNVRDSNDFHSENPTSNEENSGETPEFSSCKDLLTSGDFSEPFDEPDVSERCCPTVVDSFLTAETPSISTIQRDHFPTDMKHENPPEIRNENSPIDKQLSFESESPKHLIPCDICEYMFSNKAILAVHKQLMHKNHVVAEGSEDGAQKCSEKSRKKPLNCSWCSAAFNLKSSLMVHIKVTHPAQKESFERKEAEKVTCPACGKSFPKESALNQHMKAVHGEKPWQCSVCSKSFTTKYFLRKHKRIHTGETPYECGVCHKVFTFQQSYHKHMLYHTDDKPYCCSHCGRLFKELSTLNNHERIHSGEKPFACETCGKCFRQRVSYLVHRRIHTGAMPYKCTACNKSFRYKISQRTHKCPEHPPGVVVKTNSSLVDRLQAVIGVDEGNSGVHSNSFSESIDQPQSAPSDAIGAANASTSPLNFLLPTGHCDARQEDIGSLNCEVNQGSVGVHGGFASDSTSLADSAQDTGKNPVNSLNLKGEEESEKEIPIQNFHNSMNFDGMLERETSGNFTPENEVFSMNLDSSPSECLGKLHISSNDPYNQSVCSPQSDKNPIIPHPNLNFDNMEDLDLCTLLFDVS